MSIWIAVLAACVTGFLFGGWRSLEHARQGDLDKALTSVRVGGKWASVAAMVMAFLLLGWPCKDVTVSDPEEISRTVVETVAVPVQVTRWFFFTTTQLQKREVERTVIETVVHQRSVRGFSWFLLLPLIVVGLIGRFAHRRFVRLLWVLRG